MDIGSCELYISRYWFSRNQRCGKSTLLYCLCGLLQYKGTITFNHEVIDKKFSKMIGFIKQNNDLIPSYTVEENTMAGCYFGQIDFDKKKMDKIIRRLKIEKLMKRYPDELSIGQMKRVSIARALLKDAPVLLCDEPTGALDYKTGKLILKLLYDINKSMNKTMIVITHNVAIAAMADRVITVKSGAVESITVNENPESPERIEW